MYSTNEFRRNLKIEFEGIPFVIVDFQHVSPGKGAAFTRTKMKNMVTGAVLEKNFKSGDKVDQPDLELVEFQYLYKEDTFYYFMNTSNYEQVPLESSVVANAKDFLKENVIIQVLFFNGKPIGLELPTFIEAKIMECEQAVRGNTASGGAQKTAIIDTGAKVMVPMFINEGDLVKVDTRDGAYVEKINKSK